MISDYFSLALRSMKRRQVRSWLTMLGIFIAVATIFTLVSLSLGLEDAVEEQFRLLGTDKFFVQPRGQTGGPGTGGAVELTLDDVNVIDKTPGVKDISYFTIRSGEITVQEEKRYVNVVGISTDRIKVLEEQDAYTAEEGRLIGEDDDGYVMIGSQYRHNSFFKKSIGVGDRIEVNGNEFRVRAVLKSIGNPIDDRIVYMTSPDFKRVFNNTRRIDQIMVQIDEGEDIAEVANRVERRLRSARDVSERNQDFTIDTPADLLESFGAVLNIITTFLLGVAGISLVVGGIGITNTMYTSVLERTREIGIMKAIGARNSDVMILFLIESGLLGLAGGIVGVILGASISFFIEYIAREVLATSLLQAAMPVYLFVGCLAFSTIVGCVSGLVPSWQASQLNPVDALRHD